MVFFMNANCGHSERPRMSLAVIQFSKPPIRPSRRYFFDAGDRLVSMNGRSSGSCTQHDRVRSLFPTESPNKPAIYRAPTSMGLTHATFAIIQCDETLQLSGYKTTDVQIISELRSSA